MHIPNRLEQFESPHGLKINMKLEVFQVLRPLQTIVKEFNTQKKCLSIRAPTLSYPKNDGLFILDTDASETSIFGVLSQV